MNRKSAPAGSERATVGIVGGGPGGAALALRLCRLGHSVTIVTDGKYRYGLQGLSQRAIAALEELRAPRALQSVGPAVPRLVLWGGAAVSPNDESLIQRNLFDQALLNDAIDGGVRVVRGTVRSRALPSSGPIDVMTAGGTVSVEGAHWVEARGRAGLRALTPTLRGPATLTLQQSLKVLAGASWSAVLSAPKGWYWLGARDDGSGVLQRVIDGRPGPTMAAFDSGLVQHLADQHPKLGSFLEGARFSGRVRGFASDRMLHIGDPQHLRVGDALTAPDPLSGHGVCEAVSNSRNVAAALNTIIRSPDSAAIAHQFVAERARERHTILGSLGLHAYRQEQRYRSEPFWRTRQSDPGDSEPPTTVPAGGEVRRAPVLDHDVIVMRDVLILPGHPRGVWRVHDVPIVDLMTQLRAGCAPEQAAAALQVPPPQAARALQWITSQGIPIGQDG